MLFLCVLSLELLLVGPSLSRASPHSSNASVLLIGKCLCAVCKLKQVTSVGCCAGPIQLLATLSYSPQLLSPSLGRLRGDQGCYQLTILYSYFAF